MLKAAYVLDPHAMDLIYGTEERRDLSDLLEIVGPSMSGRDAGRHLDQLADVELILSGWGGPRMDDAILAAMPNLKAIFYGAGSIKGIVTDAFWQRNIPITSAYAANAIPVAEFTLAEILFSLKGGWQFVRQGQTRQQGRNESMPGTYGSTVGLVSLGMIGRRVAQLLRPFDLKVIAFDPVVAAERAAEVGVALRSLAQVFAESDVVSLHTPWLKETEGMIDGHLIASMKPGATLINTSRGAIINEPEMIAVLQKRSDLFAVLDVTHPEPPGKGSPLWTLPNVVLTPHIAGSIGRECRRMGRLVVEEVRLFLAGQPLRFPITAEQARLMA